MFVSQHAIELGNQTWRSIESLHRFVVAAVRGKSETLPAAEGFSAQNQKRGARSKLHRLFEQGVEDVDLRLALFDRLNGLFDLRGVWTGSTLCRFERRLELADRLFDVREVRDRLDVGLHALKSGIELLVNGFADVFDGGADFAHQFLDGFTNVRVDCARDVVAPHRHKSSQCCDLKLASKAGAIIS